MSRLGMSRAGMSRAGMSRVGAVLLLLCSLPLLASAATRDRQEAAAHAADGAQIALLERRLLAEMGAAPEQLTPEDYGAAADAFGKLVARARELGLGEQYFASLATSGERLRLACRAKVRDLERATGEDETALEALYRSELWYEINRALSAFGYWRSWALLGVAQAQGPQQRLQALHRAEAGFKAASVRILYPGLVQGAWLGLGYVALARDDPTTARQRFERLVQALAERPDNAVRKVAESELTLLALRRGEVAAPTTIPKEPLSPTLAAVVAEEAFALLERRRRENIGAMPAGERLRKLIADGYLSDALLARILAYRDEIVGEDLGVISRLIDAEFAYAYEQYKTTVIKYRQFREQGGERLPIDTGPFHYHFVIALLRTELPREARLELERLRKLPQPNPAVIAALPKLEWLIAEAVYDQHPTEANRAYFERAAGTFVAAAPKDGDVAAAHLGLARTSRDAKAVNRHLRIAGAAPALRDGVALTALHRGISDFNRAVARGDVAQQIVIARDLLAALNALPRKLRREPWQRALTLQMRAVAGEEPGTLLAAVDAMLVEASTDARVRPVLLWTRLRLLAATDDRAGLSAMADQLVARQTDADGERQFYQFLLELERQQRFSLLAPLAEHFLPALAGQGPDQRQLGLLRIRAATAQGDDPGAFVLARELVQTFPNSGDAWRAYAETADRGGLRFEADRGWAHIAAATPVGSPSWRDALLHRIALGESPEKNCALVAKLRVYQQLLNAEERTAVHTAAVPCGG